MVFGAIIGLLIAMGPGDTGSYTRRVPDRQTPHEQEEPPAEKQ